MEFSSYKLADGILAQQGRDAGLSRDWLVKYIESHMGMSREDFSPEEREIFNGLRPEEKKSILDNRDEKRIDLPAGMIDQMANGDDHLLNVLARRLASDKTHRFLQQTIFSELILAFILFQAKKPKNWYDPRNQWTVETCQKIAQAVELEYLLPAVAREADKTYGLVEVES